jgi:hypothetical protein
LTTIPPGPEALDCLDRQKRTTLDGGQNPTKTAYQKPQVAARGAEALWTAAKPLFSMTTENNLKFKLLKTLENRQTPKKSQTTLKTQKKISSRFYSLKK